MVQQTSNRDPFWARVVVVIPTLSHTRATSVVTLDQRFRALGARVVVVANGRSALDALRERGLEPLTQERNLGFSAAANLGRSAGGESLDWILLVNDDVTITDLTPFELLKEHSTGATMMTFGPEHSRPIPGAAGAFAVMSMISARRTGPHDPVGSAFTVPSGKYTGFSVVAIARSLWDSLDGLDERFPFYFEDQDFCRRAEAAGADRLAIHEPEKISHTRGASSRATIKLTLPVAAWGCLQYLQKWGLGPVRARILCTTGLALRVLLLPFSRAPIAEHFGAVIRALPVAAGLREPSLPAFEDA